MSLAELLGNVAGAINAASTGGQQEYFAALARAHAEEADRDFKREDAQRQMAFVASRDAIGRQHDLEMQRRQLADRDKDEDRQFETQAGLLFQAAKASTSIRQQLEGQLRSQGLVPEVGGSPVALDWSSFENVRGVLEDAAQQGLTQRQVEQTAGEQTKIASWYATNAPGAPAPTGPDAQTVWIQDQRRRGMAETRLTAEADKLPTFEKRLEDLRKASRENHAPFGRVYEQAKEIATETARTAAALSQLQSGELGDFFGEGAALETARATTQQRMQSFSDAIPRYLEAEQAASVSGWDPRDLSAHPVFTPGYDSGEDLERLLLSKEHTPHREAFQARLSYLQRLPREDVQFLPPAAQRAWEAVQEELAENGGTAPSLDYLLREKHSAYASGNEAAEARFDGLARQVGSIEVSDLDRGVKLNRHRIQQQATVAGFNRRTAQAGSLGFAALTPDEVAAAVQLAGEDLKEPGLPKAFPTDEAEQDKLLGAWWSTEAGLSGLVTKLMANPQDTGGLWTNKEQMRRRAQQALKQVGADNPDTFAALENQLAARTGEIASLTPSGSVGSLVGYDSTPLRTIEGTLGRGRSYADVARSRGMAEEVHAWEERLADEVFKPLGNVTPELRDRFTSELRGPHSGFRQPSGFFGSADEALRLEDEAAAEQGTAASFSDLFHFWRKRVPQFESIARSKGRVADQAIARPARAPEESISGGFIVPGSSATYRDWARAGQRASLIHGEGSFAQQYLNETAADQISEHDLNVLGFVDLMRGLSVSKYAAHLPKEEQLFLASMQETLSNMPYAEAREMLTGPAAGGIPFDRLGLALGNPQAIAQTQAMQDQRSLAEIALDPWKEAETLRRKAEELANLDDGTLVRRGEGATSELIFFQQSIHAPGEMQEIQRLQSINEAVIAARSNPMVDRAPGDFAKMLLAGDFTDGEGFVGLLNENKRLITGGTTDFTQFDQTSFEDRLANVVDFGSEDLIRQALDIYGEFASDAFSKLNPTLPNLGTPEGRATVREAQLRLGQVQEEIRVIAGEMERIRQTTGEARVRLSDLPPLLASRLARTNFEEIEDDTLAAAKVWAAYMQDRR